MSSSRTWKKLKSEVIYKYHLFTIWKDSVIRPDGEKGDYVYLEGKGAVSVIPINNKGEITFVKEYRYPPKQTFINLPAGHIDPKLSEIENAKKELMEETGMKPMKMKELGEFYVAPSTIKSKTRVFVAEVGDQKPSLKNIEGDEAIKAHITTSIPAIKKMISKGEIQDGHTLAALNIYFIKIQLDI